eukprot:2681894-Alexandrium_andersonii.AAC.1
MGPIGAAVARTSDLRVLRGSPMRATAPGALSGAPGRTSRLLRAVRGAPARGLGGSPGPLEPQH